MDLQLERIEEPCVPVSNVDAVTGLVEQLKMPLLSTRDKDKLLSQLYSKVQRCSRKELIVCLEKRGGVRLGVYLHRIHSGECLIIFSETIIHDYFY